MRRKSTRALALCALIAMLLGGCANNAPDAQKYSQTYFGAFDTVTMITGYARDEETFARAADAAFAILMRYHRACDAYQAYEGLHNLYTVNANAAKAPVRAANELFELLSWANEALPITEGRVNIALGAALSLWRAYTEAGVTVPPMDELNECARHANLSDVQLNAQDKTVTIADPLLKIDVGAIAKGYAVEKAAEYLLESDMKSFIISAGGNVRAGEKPMDGRDKWNVSIQDPNDASAYVDMLKIVNASAVTSGDYQRYTIIDGKRYHHIIDPDTLMPSTYMRSVTVICQSSALADLLSTALFLMPTGKALALAESIEGAEAYIIQNDNSVVMTSGAKALLASAD